MSEANKEEFNSNFTLPFKKGDFVRIRFDDCSVTDRDGENKEYTLFVQGKTYTLYILETESKIEPKEDPSCFDYYCFEENRNDFLGKSWYYDGDMKVVEIL